MDPVVDLVLRAALALLFVVAAGHKLRASARFRATFADYRILPAAAAPLVPALELGVAGLLVVPATAAAGKIGAAALLLVYAAAVAVNLRRGRTDLDCGCAGPAARRPIGGWLVVRNAAVAAAALAALAPVRPRPLVVLDALTAGAALLALTPLWVAADRLSAQTPAVARLREGMR